MEIYENILATIGCTPIVKLQKLIRPTNATVLAKCEFMNPGGSIKDRMALYMIEKAEREGKLKKGGTIVESTSGNTGIALSIIAAIKGYRCILTVPIKTSKEKVIRMEALGATVVIAAEDVGEEDFRNHHELAMHIFRNTKDAYFLNQYHSKYNSEAHYMLTGPEILRQTGGKLDFFVSALGSGGTMSGVGKYLKENIKGIRNIGVDMIGSAHKNYFNSEKSKINFSTRVEGIGNDFHCKTMDYSILDEIYQVDDQECFISARHLAQREGILAGGSSGGVINVACQIAMKAGRNKVVLCILSDTGTNYLSKFYSPEWLYYK